ncbi:MAG: 50S ribosomal protein L13 [Microgenomates group bacterium GW2011_GWC1_38_14]|nr:MAG: 50S ribosomal protein L13 [Candidatus Levybacteria bacterium GW2011_GWA2_36_13]KKQ00817.1 MAG: 50S ribosomal protein L13 [Candidatus Levybacteria bacterium GW2011_GWB1_36_18]KKQ58322.1 MAG: 50S ribosomal protein L13 [Microgenomates group bacterium GW2011_GWC1_38_14]KKR15915.1 MAG: 50S ribosomal protein L13 [Candidatus Levybacteria bacterium GW2011_GWA1_39_32]OGH43857.1 MAG: 50S ribosomal protein L13 [Candidatus Levybacteria bacterium RIFCSPLOWO2_02_FULL_37_11]
MKATKLADIKREWHLIDIKDKILGRISTDIASLLMGKSKPYFVKNLDCGDYVVVINAENVKVSGNKKSLKTYSSHSGYPGGFKSQKFSELIEKNPDFIMRHAVLGMLPQNKLRDKMIKRLYIFKGSEHKFADKFKTNG